MGVCTLISPRIMATTSPLVYKFSLLTAQRVDLSDWGLDVESVDKRMFGIDDRVGFDTDNTFGSSSTFDSCGMGLSYALGDWAQMDPVLSNETREWFRKWERDDFVKEILSEDCELNRPD
jgi:hypothetical protein